MTMIDLLIVEDDYGCLRDPSSETGNNDLIRL